MSEPIKSVSEFILKNQLVFGNINSDINNNRYLLIDGEGISNILHCNALMAKAIRLAKGYKPIYIGGDLDKLQQEILTSYDSEVIFLSIEKLNWVEMFIYKLRYKWNCAKMKITKNIIDFKINGIPFGDILYDSYLVKNKTGTITEINNRVLERLDQLMMNYYCIKKTILKTNKIAALLLTDYHSIKSGVLFRTALSLGIKVYQNGGASLTLYNSINEVYLKYHQKPNDADFAFLMQLPTSFIEEEYNKEIKKDNLSKDLLSFFAYDNSYKYFNNKEEFYEHTNLDPNKKNIFVMLNVFHDMPNAIVGPSLFRDFYQWFLKVLNFAKYKTDVNWIFKEHPISKYFPYSDIDMPSHFDKNDKHIYFMDYKSKINTGSLGNVADVILTVVGSSGIEIAAGFGVPVILGCDNFYNGLCFTIDPKSEKEYFEVLANVGNIKKLTKEQQYIAKVVFLFVKKYSIMPVSWEPKISPELYFSDEFYSNKYKYYELVLNHYKNREELMKKQLKVLVADLKKNDFSKVFGYPFNNNYNDFYL